MKKNILLAIVLVSVGCSKKNKNEKTSISFDIEKPALASSEKEKHPIYKNWLSYYQKNNSDFSEERFEKTNESLITYLPSNITAKFDEQFDEVYTPFLVFNATKTKYIDFDSYYWHLDKYNEVSFEADQQVNLIDMERKTKQQIGFFGPSFTIENAFWKGDSIVVLLGNTYEKVPFKVKYNLQSGKQTFYQSKDTLQFEKPYFKERLRQQGLKVE